MENGGWWKWNWLFRQVWSSENTVHLDVEMENDLKDNDRHHFPNSQRSGKPVIRRTRSTISTIMCQVTREDKKIARNVPIDLTVPRKSIFDLYEPWKNRRDITKDFQSLPEFEKIVFESSYLGDIKRLKNVLNIPDIKIKGCVKDLINSSDIRGRTPLHFACAFGYFDIVEQLLLNGSNPSAVDSTGGVTPLICATVIGDERIMSALIAKNIDINQEVDSCEGETSTTALHWAVKVENIGAVKYLLDKGACLTGKIINRETLLHEAASSGNDEILKLLLQYHSNHMELKGGLHNCNFGTALHVAVEQGRERCIEALLTAGACPNTQNGKGETPLHMAVLNADIEAITLLLSNNGDSDIQDDFGRTPLHCCALNGNHKDITLCLQLLLSKSSDVNIQDDLGYTAFHLAVMYDSSPVVAILLHHGADLTISIKSGQSGLEILMKKMPHAIRYVKESLDLAISLDYREITDPKCTLILDFRAIVTTVEGNVPKYHRETEFLTSLCKAGQRSILSHPLIEAFLILKWQKVRKYIWASFFANLLMVLTYSWFLYFVYKVSCPIPLDTMTNSNSKSMNTSHFKCEGNESGDVTSTLKIVWILLIIMAVIFSIKEVLHIMESVKAYMKLLENYVQIFFLITIAVTMWPVGASVLDDNYLCDHLSDLQYRFAAVGTTVGWFLVLLRIGRLPRLGLYVQMLLRVVLNFGIFMTAYASILIAFSLSFTILINKGHFKNIFVSLQAVLVMMTGEFDIDDFENHPLPLVTYMILVGFVILVTIVLMNLLVGLAVSDIQGLRNGAKVARLSRIVVAISYLESVLFSKGLIRVLPAFWMKRLQRSVSVIGSEPRSRSRWERVRLLGCAYFRPHDPRDTRLPQSLKMEALEIVQARAGEKILNRNQINTEMEARMYKRIKNIEKSLESLADKVDKMYEMMLSGFKK